jgi:hypothetical protein
LNPFSRNHRIGLLEKQKEYKEIYTTLRESGENIPYSFLPEKGGLLIVGLTDNGDAVFWKTGDEPWGIVVDESRGPDYFAFDGGIVEFVHGLLTGEVNCTVFPMDAFRDRSCTPY